MNTIRPVAILSVSLVIIFNLITGLTIQAPTRSVEEIIGSYLDAKGMEDIQTNAEDYKSFMRGIIWEEYPELTGENSEFVKSQDELDELYEYAWEHSGYEALYEQFHEPSSEAAVVPQGGLTQPEMAFLPTALGRLNAIAYAYEWSESGTNTHHNPDYPDFGYDDCTNFISQAMNAGGFEEIGSGDGCKHEDTSTEWYMDPNPNPSIFCTGDFRDWEWSTSWTVAWPFRSYFAYQNSYAIAHGWTTSAALAKYYLSPGDVVQLQVEAEPDVWTTYHTMIITSEDVVDIYVTYHSNVNGYDEVDKPLSSIDLGTNKRFQLVEIIYPSLDFFPLVMNENAQTSASKSSRPNPINSPLVVPDALTSPLQLPQIP